MQSKNSEAPECPDSAVTGLEVDGDSATGTSALQRFPAGEEECGDGQDQPGAWSVLGTLTAARDGRSSGARARDRRRGEEIDPEAGRAARRAAVRHREGLGRSPTARPARSSGGSTRPSRWPMASTTKIMTALVVLRLAGARPRGARREVDLLRAGRQDARLDSGVRAGERLPVRELLYGLLLPSGNDAAVALRRALRRPARADRATRPDEADPLPRFVAEMNRVGRGAGAARDALRQPARAARAGPPLQRPRPGRARPARAGRPGLRPGRRRPASTAARWSTPTGTAPRTSSGRTPTGCSTPRATTA